MLIKYKSEMSLINQTRQNHLNKIDNNNNNNNKTRAAVVCLLFFILRLILIS